MTTRQAHPFGGEAAVLYLSIQDQIEKQIKYLTVADVWAVLALLTEESRAQLGMDMMAKLHAQALKERCLMAGAKVGAGGTASE